MAIIYVQDRHGKPLAPTTRGGHVRRLLDSKQTRVSAATHSPSG